MSTPRQIDTITAKMMLADPDRAADFSHAMYRANEFAKRAGDLRRSAWQLYREVMNLPAPGATRRKPKGDSR